jgi:hypothetical protein
MFSRSEQHNTMDYVYIHLFIYYHMFRQTITPIISNFHSYTQGSIFREKLLLYKQ